MKKITTLFLVSLLAINTTACSLIGGVPAEEKAPPEPFNFETELTEEDVAYFTESDDIVTLLSATPYYMGKHSLSVPAFKEFDQLKKKKIDEAKNLTNQLHAQTKKLKEQLTPFKVALHQFVSVAYEHEPKIKDFAQDLAAQFLEFNLKEASATLTIKASEEQSPKNHLAQSFLEYQKTSAVLQLATVLYEDLGHVFANSSQLASAFEDHKNPEIKAAYTTFNTQMEKFDELNETLTTINQKSKELNLVLAQLDTAEYQMGMASLGFIQEKMPAVKAEIEKLQPSESLSSEDIEFIKAYTDQFDSFTTGLQKIAAKADKSNLLLDEKNTEARIIPAATAGFADSLSSAFSVLKETAKTTAEAARLTWRGAKTTVGVGLDVLDAGAGAVFDVGFGLYNGTDLKTIGNDVYNNVAQVKSNFDKGASGSKVLDTAYDYLDGTEKALEKFTADQVAKQTGKGRTSWLMGKVAKLTTGMFTGLGKGMFKVANTQSTNAEIAEGSLDIAFSFIGGSKVIMKGSQAVSGSKTGIKLLGQKGVNFVKETWNKVKLNDLKTLYKEAVKQGGEEAAEVVAKITGSIASREALEQTLKETSKSINDDMFQAVKDGAKTVLDNLKGGKDSYDEFVKTMYGDDTLMGFLSGLKQSIDDVAGTSLKDYFDNLVGGALDDAIKGQVTSYVESSFGKFGGTYSGALAIEGVSIPIVVEVDGYGFTGNITTTLNLTIFDEPLTIAVKAQIEGTIDEEAKVKGELSGTASTGGDQVGFSGSFDGAITEETMKVTNLIFVTSEGSSEAFTVILRKA